MKNSRQLRAKWLPGLLPVISNNGGWAWIQYKVKRETGYVLCRIALWDCFGVAIASFIGYYEVAQDSGSKFVA